MRMRDEEERESYVLPERDELIEAQKADPHLWDLREKFEVLPDAEKVELQKSKEGIFVKDDILFRRVAKKVVFVTGGKQYKRFNVQICIPSDNNIKRAVLYSVHGIPISGHDGKARSRQRLEDLY